MTLRHLTLLTLLGLALIGTAPASAAEPYRAVRGAPAAGPVSYTHLTLPTTPYV